MNMWTYNLTNEAYHKLSAVGSSDLKMFRKLTPKHFLAYKNKVRKPTAEMQMGTWIHSAILEPGSVDFIIEPDFSGKGSRAAKAAWEDSLACNVIPVTETEFKTINSARDAVLSCEDAMELLTDGHAEVSGFFHNIVALVDQKIRPDYLTDNYIVDLKTTECAIDFEETIFKDSFLYHMQAAYYVDTAEMIDGKKREFFWIVVERDAPFSVRVMHASGDALQEGRHLWQEAMKKYSYTSRNNAWVGFENEVKYVTVPSWYKRRFA